MPVDVVVLGATAALAVVALVAAVVAVRASRRSAAPAGRPAPSVQTPSLEPAPATPSLVPDLAPRPADVVVVRSTQPPQPARVVDGRVVVPPTAEQVAAAALTRPSVRFTALLHGLAHALRPESRDRIGALVRREYRDRRRTRLRAGRRAVRAAHPTPPGERWLGELPTGEVRES